MREIFQEKTIRKHLTFFKPVKNVLNRLNDPVATNEA